MLKFFQSLKNQKPAKVKALVINSKENAKNFYKKPLWLPAFPYYSLVLIFSLLLFAISLVVLHEVEDKPFWIAGLLATTSIFTAFIFREFFLRKSRDAFLKAQKRLDDNLRVFASPKKREKLTLEKNLFLIRQIERKSEAAKVLVDLAEVHRNVFESCNEYLNLVEKELKEISAESPRLVAILKGKRKVEQIRKYHVLVWAELEAQNMMNSLKNLEKTSEKLRLTRRTLENLKIALSYYPNERKLVESVKAVEELMVSIKVSSHIKKANRASSQGKYNVAVEYYQNALNVLEQSKDVEKHVLIEKINQEIQRLLGEENKSDQPEMS